MINIFAFYFVLFCSCTCSRLGLGLAQARKETFHADFQKLRARQSNAFNPRISQDIRRRERVRLEVFVVCSPLYIQRDMHMYVLRMLDIDRRNANESFWFGAPCQPGPKRV